MKTGIELIAEEREEQITKHGRTIQNDIDLNDKYQLIHAAETLIYTPDLDISKLQFYWFTPTDWDFDIWQKMVNKTYKERLIIAGALIAAEIDRIQN